MTREARRLERWIDSLAQHPGPAPPAAAPTPPTDKPRPEPSTTRAPATRQPLHPKAALAVASEALLAAGHVCSSLCRADLVYSPYWPDAPYR
jgi:hypothetical protein